MIEDTKDKEEFEDDVQSENYWEKPWTFGLNEVTICLNVFKLQNM